MTKTDLLIEAYEMLHRFEHHLRHPCKDRKKERAQDLIKVIQLIAVIEVAMGWDIDARL